MGLGHQIGKNRLLKVSVTNFIEDLLYQDIYDGIN